MLRTIWILVLALVAALPASADVAPYDPASGSTIVAVVIAVVAGAAYLLYRRRK